MASLTLHPIKRVSGEIRLPGSKSLSNRALLLAALAEGDTTIRNLLASDDTSRMVESLRKLGTELYLSEDGEECRVVGHGGSFPEPAEPLALYLGNAGTAIRPLTAALCLGRGEFHLSGDAQMHERPIEHLVDALQQLGASVSYAERPGYPPLRIAAAGLRGGEASIPGNISSQYLTALLLALPLAGGDSTITVIGEQVSKPYLDITLHMMSRFGVEADHREYQEFRIPGRQRYRSPGSLLVEGDASSATYFLAAAAIRGGPVRVHGIGTESIQGDVQFVDVLEAMGARVTRSRDWIEVSRGSLSGIDMDLNHIPDAAMTVATLALFAEGPTAIRNIYNWRVKETNRMDAMATELRKLGATVVTGEDFIEISPPAAMQPAAIDTYGDHRIAMAFSLAALDDVPITIHDPGVTAKTFPEYFDELARISDPA